MSKEIYAVCCYTCEHNGQETCKGCNTILNGENEPYENWQLREDLCQKDKQIADLQSQLAEKDKELKQVKLDLGMFKSVNEFINSYGIEKAREVLLQTEKTKNQDKISFALEQLEKVKELCKTKFEWWENSEWEGNIYDKSDVSNAYFDIEANIDQQIALLKGKVEDE